MRWAATCPTTLLAHNWANIFKVPEPTVGVEGDEETSSIFPVNPEAYQTFIETSQLFCQGFMIDRISVTSEN